MIIGIDLGTTNSEVAIHKDGKISIVEENGSPIMPSCVGINLEGKLVVGQEARNQYAIRPDHTIRSVKRKMGSDESVKLGEKDYRPAEISALILKQLKLRAENALGAAVKQAVITVPAYFNVAQRQATREAGDLAGLEVLRILNEPTAAGLAFEAAGVDDTKHIMVYDLGGGTFDVSILKMSGDVVEVLASHGDSHLGGDDIDELLYEYSLSHYYTTHPDSKPLSTAGMNRLRLACEQLKIDLSNNASATLAETGLQLDDNTLADLSLEMSRTDFEEHIDELLRKTLGSVRHVMAQAGLHAGELDDIILVGGSTRIPAVIDLLEAELDLRPRFDINPDLAVATGAGVMAARLAGETTQRILVDVTPYTFGTSALGMVHNEYGPHRFCPIIKAGTPLPAQRGQVFYTAYPGQEAVQINVFQGEDIDARLNTYVGEFKVENLDDEADDKSPILINMHLDLDGILTVTAIEQHTGLSKSVVIDRALEISDKNVLESSRSKIEELFGNEDFIPIEREVEEGEIVQIDPDVLALLKRAENSRSTLEEEDRQDLDGAIADLNEAQSNNNPEAAAEAREIIEDILFYIEGAQ